MTNINFIKWENRDTSKSKNKNSKNYTFNTSNWGTPSIMKILTTGVASLSKSSIVASVDSKKSRENYL